ncbi:multidrug ABC transporter permease/ATP-binding protein, partial [Campylobacter coli]
MPSFALVFLPSYESIGILATLILFLIRILQGLAVGTEVSGAWGVFFISSTIVELGLSVFGQNFIFKMQRRVVKQILDTPLLKVAKVGKA